jgi:hypothetical protein
MCSSSGWMTASCQRDPATNRVSLTMIDPHYGHLARDGREHAIRLLDELSAGQRPRWTLVDAAWTPNPTTDASGDNESSG